MCCINIHVILLHLGMSLVSLVLFLYDPSDLLCLGCLTHTHYLTHEFWFNLKNFEQMPISPTADPWFCDPLALLRRAMQIHHFSCLNGKNGAPFQPEGCIAPWESFWELHDRH